MLMLEDDATNSDAIIGSGVLYGICEVEDCNMLCILWLRRMSAGGFTMVEGVLRLWFCCNRSTQGS